MARGLKKLLRRVCKRCGEFKRHCCCDNQKGLFARIFVRKRNRSDVQRKRMFRRESSYE